MNCLGMWSSLPKGAGSFKHRRFCLKASLLKNTWKWAKSVLLASKGVQGLKVQLGLGHLGFVILFKGPKKGVMEKSTDKNKAGNQAENY